jgi:1-acyl-sn-glycerol-3-phosphate acyltransferase
MKNDIRSNVTYRHPLIYGIAVVLSRLGIRYLSNTHEEISPAVTDLHKQGYRFIYIGLHKSLWETTGVQAVLHRNHLTVPYAAMGDNLIRGRFYQAIAKRSGLFLVKRASGRQGLLESAASLKEAIINHIKADIHVIIYPEGTRKNIPQYGRYGNFFTTVFEAAIELEQTGIKLALIPVNIDYGHVREDHEMLHPSEKNPRTLHILDSLKMLAHLGDIFVSLGAPIVLGQQPWNRKTLAAHLKQSCLDLIKILPINIVSWSIYSLIKREEFGQDALNRDIEAKIQILAQHQSNFRGFDLSTSGAALFEQVASGRKEFLEWQTRGTDLSRFFKLYRDYISHLIEPDGPPQD